MLYNNLLRGELVYLDGVTREDIPLYGKWFANLEMLYNLFPGAVFPQTEESETDWYENMRKSNDYIFAIRTIASKQLIGSTGLHAPDWRNRCAVFGISIGDPDYWGKGYGTDTTRIVVRYGFMELNLHRIELIVFDYNKRAIRVYEKVGFKHEGVRRQAHFRDGEYHDVHLMSILRHEWDEA